MLKGSEKKKNHFYKDENDFYPLAPVLECVDNYFTIMFDHQGTRGVNATAELCYQRNVDNFYLLKKDMKTGLYTLVKKNNESECIPDGKYEYILELMLNGAINLKIGRMPHFYLNSKKSNGLVVAGDIYFNKQVEGAEIILVNDKSGGFHIGDTYLDLLKLKKDSIKKAIVLAGLPLDKFEFHAKKEEVTRVHSL